MEKQMRGIVKWYSARLGYGFITSESGEDYFIHWDEIKMDGFRHLTKDDEVVFLPSENNGKPEAKQAIKI